MKTRFSQIKPFLVIGSLSLLLSGCFSVVRLTKLPHGTQIKHWSEEQQAYVYSDSTEPQRDMLGQFGLYPTMGIRWQLLRLTWNWSPPQYYWQRRVALPVAWVLMLPGGVVDLVVDTVALPWDWKYRGNDYDLVAEETEEHQRRSLCISRSKVSDGAFALCHRTCERNTPFWNMTYGVCPDCIETVKTNGYYFAAY